MTADEIDNLTTLMNKMKRYSQSSCETLSTLVYESECLEETERIEIDMMDVTILFSMISQYVTVRSYTDTLLNAHNIEQMLVEIFLNTANYSDDRTEEVEMYEIFYNDLVRSMTEYELEYEVSHEFTPTILSNLMTEYLKLYSRLDPFYILGWYNKTSLYIIEGL